jgi:trk system potassium uptake protein
VRAAPSARAGDSLSQPMYIVIAGGGKVGANLARTLLGLGHELTLIEQRRDRFERLEEELEHQVQHGDATEIYVLERAGIARPPDLVLAVTGDDEDNIVICQIAREKYGVPKVIARVNDPRNQEHFDLLGIAPTVCATSNIMALVEHEVPEHGLIHLLELRNENLEIVEIQIDKDSPSAGKTVERLELPPESRLISVTRDGQSEIAVGSTQLRPGDRVLAILQPGLEDEVRRALLKS